LFEKWDFERVEKNLERVPLLFFELRYKRLMCSGEKSGVNSEVKLVAYRATVKLKENCNRSLKEV